MHVGVVLGGGYIVVDLVQIDFSESFMAVIARRGEGILLVKIFIRLIVTLPQILFFRSCS